MFGKPVGAMPTGYTFLLEIVLGVAAVVSFAQHPNEYVGDVACRQCHENVYKSYGHVSMSQSFARIDQAVPIEDWTSKNRLFHSPSNQYFVMSTHDGRFFQKRYQLDDRGREINTLEVEIQFAIGSGKHERDYLYRSKSGELLQFPVVWYTVEKRWGMAPGYDRPDHDGFSRRVNYRCVFCHVSYPNIAPGGDRSETQISLFPAEMPSGIGCERCHGPGQQHAGNPSTSNIVNPAKLDRNVQMDVCLQCHLETTSASLPNSVLKLGRGIFSFRPGERLEDYAAYFDYPAGTGHDDDFNIVHQGYRLRKSLCYAKSSMTCLTCHDPHSLPTSPETFYNAKCSTCHADPSSRNHGDDCVGCHMPKRRTDDIVHVIMTDHFIQRRPPTRLLTPKTERAADPYRGPLIFYLPEQRHELYLGMALTRGADVQGGVKLLEKATKQERLQSAEPWFQLAAGYAASSQPQKSIESYQRGLKIDPQHAEARFNMAMVLMETGRTKQAVETLRQAIRQNPKIADAHVALGAAEVKLGNTSSAEEEYRRALDVDPQNILALDNLGLLALQTGQIEAAHTYFLQVLRIKPDDPVAMRNIVR